MKHVTFTSIFAAILFVVAIACFAASLWGQEHFGTVLKTVQEGQTQAFTTVYRDEQGAATVPDSACLTVSDESTGTRLYGPVCSGPQLTGTPTPLPTPGSASQRYILPPEASRIISEAHANENRLLSQWYRFSNGTKQGHRVYRYSVANSKAGYVGCAQAPPTPCSAWNFTPYAQPTPTSPSG